MKTLLDRSSTVAYLMLILGTILFTASCSSFSSQLDMSQISTIATGQMHTLFVTQSGELWAVGSNKWGALGLKENHKFTSKINSRGHHYADTPLKVMEGVKQSAAGNHYSVALRQDGTLWFMGRTDSIVDGQVVYEGKLDSMPPMELMRDVVKISSGYNHTLILKHDKTLWGLGTNTYGQLAIPTNTGSLIAVLGPVKIAADVASIFAGPNNTFVLMSDGSLWSCGGEISGELGYQGSTERNEYTGISNNAVLRRVAVENAVSVSCGWQHTLVLDRNGILWGMGSNAFGQLGLANDINSISRPTEIMEHVVSAAAGSAHTLALTDDGVLWGMGDNQYGQLGDASEQSVLPTQIMDEVQDMWACENHTIIRKRDGTFVFWGQNIYGQLGEGR